jgi:DNA-binding MarR family transcriptional regulator
MVGPDLRSSVLDDLFDMAPLFQRLVAEGLERRRLTQPRIRLLMRLADEGPLAMSEVARALDVTPRAVTALVDALERDGFVNRGARQGDRRTTLVTLTARGRRTVRELRTGYARLADRLLGRVSEEDLAATLRVLAAVRADLQPAG